MNSHHNQSITDISKLALAQQIEFPGICEQLNNSDLKPVEFDGIRMQAGLNSFTPDGYELKTLDGYLKGLGYLK
ncbi:MAG: hypothetical protein MUP98_21275 [Candidatus Aminicenantes bacterium]|nr:hypothetical protein [Candidatus Aminicenantes bacterium]